SRAAVVLGAWSRFEDGEFLAKTEFEAFLEEGWEQVGKAGRKRTHQVETDEDVEGTLLTKEYLLSTEEYSCRKTRAEGEYLQIVIANEEYPPPTILTSLRSTKILVYHYFVSFFFLKDNVRFWSIKEVDMWRSLLKERDMKYWMDRQKRLWQRLQRVVLASMITLTHEYRSAFNTRVHLTSTLGVPVAQVLMSAILVDISRKSYIAA
ncbi:hypothetical protein BT69DRAFT_1302264, partial [Atractiella rhizophila]